MLHANFITVCFMEQELLTTEDCEKRDTSIQTFLLLWLWTWPYDLHIRTWPVLSGGRPMCKYELLTSRLL